MQAMSPWIGRCEDPLFGYVYTDLKLEEDGSCSMKSIEMEFQGRAGTGNCLSSLKGQCRGVLALMQVVQDLT